jgi:hypothetical protein
MTTISTSSTSSTSSNTGYASFFVLRVLAGKRSYADKGGYLTRESAQAYADQLASLLWDFGLDLAYVVYSGAELQALLDSGVRVYLW